MFVLAEGGARVMQSAVAGSNDLDRSSLLNKPQRIISRALDESKFYWI
jgi:hypothetical protein